MRSYAQYCPVAKATEILGDRWTLLIVREMVGGASGFNEIQRGLPGISRSVLTDRMRWLERAQVIERRTGPSGRTLGYRLTPAGRDLQPVLQAIGEWGATWSFTEPRPEEVDPDLLIVWMARHVDRHRLPPNRTVVQFDFRDPERRYWMVLERSEVSVCLKHPGFALQRGFGLWFTWSAFAPTSRSAQERRTAASRLASPHRVRVVEDADPAPRPPRK
jgi:DNA-binding HxlR family transcriptional regulator